jgi:hypothetical protein
LPSVSNYGAADIIVAVPAIAVEVLRNTCSASSV